jgi:large subunit ribosomal protein L3
MRTGLVAKKVGMSRVYDDAGNFIPVTLLQLDNCVVVGHKTLDKDGYNALQLGFGKAKAKHTSKPLEGFYKKAGIEPCKAIFEFRIKEDAFVEVGKELSVDHFVKDQFIDVTGITIGKGFAGVVKRHNFKTLDASHGNSLTHRSHGSTGNRQDPGRVFKGKKMAGHLGNTQITQQNLKIVDIDPANNILVVKGAVPGYKGSLLTIKDAVKKKQEKLPYPAAVK